MTENNKPAVYSTAIFDACWMLIDVNVDCVLFHLLDCKCADAEDSWLSDRTTMCSLILSVPLISVAWEASIICVIADTDSSPFSLVVVLTMTVVELCE